MGFHSQRAPEAVSTGAWGFRSTTAPCCSLSLPAWAMILEPGKGSELGEKVNDLTARLALDAAQKLLQVAPSETLLSHLPSLPEELIAGREGKSRKFRSYFTEETRCCLHPIPLCGREIVP